ncbi:energy transducer TonB [Flavobacterium sp.]|uniref:energy transducer TonB n=1 Tax=Flavobacterium sp. TaxID=239 RepID=UPI003918B816
MKAKLLFSCLFYLLFLAQTVVANTHPTNWSEFTKAKSNKIIYQIDKFNFETRALSIKQEDTLLYLDSSLKVKPEYPGGVTTFNAHINIVLKNPKSKKGDVLVNFIVEKDGSLSNIKILKGLDDETDNEIYEVLKNSPKWKPAEQSGEKVRCIMPLFLTINGRN